MDTLPAFLVAITIAKRHSYLSFYSFPDGKSSEKAFKKALGSYGVSKYNDGTQLFDSIALQRSFALSDFLRFFARPLISSSQTCSANGGVAQESHSPLTVGLFRVFPSSAFSNSKSENLTAFVIVILADDGACHF